MPTYEYQCRVCGHQLEAFQKMSDAPLLECPACQGDTLQKLVSAVGFHLKGTGWYVTDFRDKGKPLPVGKAESGTSADSGAGAGDRSDPAQKTAATAATAQGKKDDLPKTGTTGESS